VIIHEVHGHGPVVLLTHGFAASSRMFGHTVAALATDHTVVVWDQLGHGRSDAPDDPAVYSVAASVEAMLALLDGVGAERAVLLGHSLGGYLSLELALAHPARVRALVLVDTGPGYRSDRGRAGWNELADGYARSLEERGLAGLPAGAELDAHEHRSARGLALAARGVLRQADAHVIECLSSIGAPALVVVGEHDAPFRKGADHLAANLPEATLAVIPGAGHAPPVTHPEQFERVVRTFLASLPPSEPSR